VPVACPIPWNAESKETLKKEKLLWQFTCSALQRNATQRLCVKCHVNVNTARLREPVRVLH